eukprot:8012225-Lingulodinium_polyedra.AAC.1
MYIIYTTQLKGGGLPRSMCFCGHGRHRPGLVTGTAPTGAVVQYTKGIKQWLGRAATEAAYR